MNISSFLFLSFLNLLVAAFSAFVVTGVLRKKCLGGFWGSFVVALIGALVGTVSGIYFGNHRIVVDLAIIRYIFPVVGAGVATVIFVSLHSGARND